MLMLIIASIVRSAKEITVNARRFVLVCTSMLALILMTAPAFAQQQATVVDYRSAEEKAADSTNIIGNYGYMWGGSTNSSIGQFKLKGAPSYGLSLDFAVDIATWLEISFIQQGGELTYSPGGDMPVTDLAVNYFHLGLVKGFVHGATIPYLSLSLGATNYNPDAEVVTIGDEDYDLSSSTKFSVGLGLGAKHYFGSNRMFGVRGQVRTLATIFASSSGVWFGDSTSLSGWSIWQFEASAGLVIRLGS